LNRQSPFQSSHALGNDKFREMKRPHRGRISKRCCVFELLIIINTTQQETIAAGRSMCLQQETDTVEVE